MVVFRRLWVVLLLGCSGGGDVASDPQDAAIVDAQPDASLGPSEDGQCHLPGFEPGACCQRDDGATGLCTPEGCTDGVAAQFHPLCLALCAEQCIVGEQLGPCCQTAAGVGVCAAGQCLDAQGPQASPTCETLAALPEGVGCGGAIPKTPTDDPCELDIECDEGLCAIPEGAPGYCSQPCDPDVECPRWFACIEEICLRAGRLGQGCQDSGQCRSGLCVRVEGAATPYCTTQCSVEAPCPEGLECDLTQETCLLPVEE